MDSQQIVFTGIGIVSPFGFGKDIFWKNLTEGNSGISPIELFDTNPYDSHLGGVFSTFDPKEILSKKGLRLLDRTTCFALCASKLAMDDAQINLKETNGNKLGIVLSSTCGSPKSRSDFYYSALTKGQTSLNPAQFPNTVVNSPASQVSIRFGIKGLNNTVSTGFTGTLTAIDYASKLLKSNQAEIILAGGTEELCEMLFSSFHKTGFLSHSKNGSKEISSPFDKNRNGAVLGEGSVIFILETLEHARSRKAPVFGYYTQGTSVFDKDAFNQYNLKGTGAKSALHTLFEQNEFNPESIDLIVSGANSTREGDFVEARILNQFFGNNESCLITAPKSALGESFSSSGGFQIATALMSMNTGMVPPTINTKNSEKTIRDVLLKTTVKKDIRHALITAFSPMCQQSVCVIKNTIE